MLLWGTRRDTLQQSSSSFWETLLKLSLFPLFCCTSGLMHLLEMIFCNSGRLDILRGALLARKRCTNTALAATSANGQFIIATGLD